MPPLFYPALADTITNLPFAAIPTARLQLLDEMADYLIAKRRKGEEIRLNFICTHNSRRSQLSQVWAQTAAAYYGIDATCYSGGVEVTAFNERAVAALQRDGFKVIQKANSAEYQFTAKTAI
jgi:arsenate reductase